MNARPRIRPERPHSFGAFATDMVGRTLVPERLQALSHPEDWPLPAGAPALSPATWDRALAEIARDILSRPSHQFRARMCALAWRLADGTGDVPAVLPFLVEVIHAGSLIVDDIEDDSRERRGAPCLHLLHGTPLALNAGSWMYFWALDLVQQVPLPAAHGERLHDELRRALCDTMYGCHLGQSLDLSVGVGDLPRGAVYHTVATTTALKTGALMELAARLGALAAGACQARVEALARFGRRLGIGLQMLDDFGNLNASHAEDPSGKSLEDLRNGRSTWPWALAAEELDEPEFSRLQASARALAPGTDPDGTRTRALAAALRMAVGLKGRRQTKLYLQRALADLREQVGERDELTALVQELDRLEAAYG